ncbi:hypothetical protein OESDEN_10216 [Oesophagostomum dentatum]|uniref:Cytochrome c domain-containing protein n=1 Tax=Oesophagostomum dentatum TaxID=61180 RepID=A0A0B1SY89_OESDE|nr:hypothetical protein OESDEN_10216 [Oesophagostomum dentatum]
MRVHGIATLVLLFAFAAALDNTAFALMKSITGFTDQELESLVNIILIYGTSVSWRKKTTEARVTKQHYTDFSITCAQCHLSGRLTV